MHIFLMWWYNRKIPVPRGKSATGWYLWDVIRKKKLSRNNIINDALYLLHYDATSHTYELVKQILKGLMITILVKNIFFLIYSLEWFRNAFLKINQNLSVCRRVLREPYRAHNSLLHKQGSCHIFVNIGSKYW